MSHFSKKSKSILATVDFRLVHTLDEVIRYYDFSVLSGYRYKDEQEKLFKEGSTQRHWPDSAHNQNAFGYNAPPAKAVDIAPYPIDWDDAKRFIYLAGLVLGTARAHGLNLLWGGNWDADQVIIDDQNFNDLGHFEIIGNGNLI